MKQNRIFIICIIIIAALGFLAYANSLKGEFIWDDNYLIEDNVYIRYPLQIDKIFTRSLGAGAGIQSTSYRPLQTLSYAMNYSLSKLDTKSYHFVNMLLHIMAGLCIWWLVGLICRDRLIPFLTGVFFVVHPIHTGAVAYISGRADSLAAVFMLLSFIFYIKHINGARSSCALLALTYVCAVLSRENSTILPVLFLLYHYAFKKPLKTGYFLPVAFIAFAYVLLRVTLLKELLPINESGITFFQRIPGFFVAVFTYVKLLFLPFNLHMEYGNKVFSFTDPMAISGALITIGLLIYAFRERKKDNLAFFSILWFFIALLPVSNLYPINAYMAEHWLYFPSIGFFLLLARGFDSLYRRRSFKIFAIISITAILVFFSRLTVRQNSYWKDPITFGQRMLKYVEDSSRVYNDLGKEYNSMGKYEEAIPLLRKAIEVDPKYIEAHNNLGNSLSGLGRKKDALLAYRKAIEVNPKYAKGYYNIGIVYHETGKPEDAIAAYKKALEIDPNHTKAYYNLAIVYQDKGQYKDAILLYEKAIEINPNYAQAYNNLGAIYERGGMIEKAIILYKEAIKIRPNYKRAHDNLNAAYKKKEAKNN